MGPTRVPRPAVSRRRFLRLAAAAAGVAAAGAPAWRQAATAADDVHRPRLRLPAATSNGSRVPITVDVAHPMDPGHHVTSITVVNPRDPVPVKGTFHFTPASGRAHVAFQARLDEGPSAVVATADCGRHGRFSASAPVTVAAGGGGCAGGPPAPGSGDGEIRPPVIRIPRLVAGLPVGDGEIIDVQVKVKHPSRTGLALRDGRFVQEAEPFHLRDLEVFRDGERVSRFVLGAAMSDNPLITFKLRARPEATVAVALTNTRGDRFEATARLRAG